MIIDGSHDQKIGSQTSKLKVEAYKWKYSINSSKYIHMDKPVNKKVC